MVVCRFATLLIDDPEVPVAQRFIMTVNSGDVVQFPIERELDCPLCNDQYPEMMQQLKDELSKATEAKINS